MGEDEHPAIGSVSKASAAEEASTLANIRQGFRFTQVNARPGSNVLSNIESEARHQRLPKVSSVLKQWGCKSPRAYGRLNRGSLR